MATALIGLGGVLYTVGAVMYARRRPDPLPDVFGYHEVFHALTIAGASAHYAVIAFWVLPLAAKALDVVAERQEALAGEEKPCLVLVPVGDVDEDLLLEIEQLQDGRAFARCRPSSGSARESSSVREVRTKSCSPALRGRRVAVKLALGSEADADIAAVVVPEARVDADVDRLARVREGPDPAADVDLLVAVEGDGVDGADHAALGLFDVGRDRRLAERLRDHGLKSSYPGFIQRRHSGMIESRKRLVCS